MEAKLIWNQIFDFEHLQLNQTSENGQLQHNIISRPHDNIMVSLKTVSFFHSDIM
jgi:hypothetical protein